MIAVLCDDVVYVFGDVAEALRFIDYWQQECGRVGRIITVIDRR